jgi:hypothetical protein
MGEPPDCIFCRDGHQSSPYRLNQRLSHACALLAHKGFDLTKGFLYGVEVRSVDVSASSGLQRELVFQGYLSNCGR